MRKSVDLSVQCDDEDWCDAAWAWVLCQVPVDCIPFELHVALLRSASVLMCYCGVEGNVIVESDSKDAAGKASKWNGGKLLKRFCELVVPYLQALPVCGGDVTLQTSLCRDLRVLEGVFELCAIPHNSVRQAVEQFLGRAFGVQGMGVGLQQASSRDAYAIARGCASCFRRVVDAGVGGRLFPCLQHVFLQAGQVLPSVLHSIDEHERKLVAELAWSVCESFLRARAHFRSQEFMGAFPGALFDVTAARFFAFLKALWPEIQSCGVGVGIERKSVAATHAEWLPSLGKWGGINSQIVRRHWCECVSDVLRVVNKGQQGRLTKAELGVFEKLLARRDLWSDDQVLVLTREIPQLQVGNLGAASLADLPSRGSKSPTMHVDSADQVRLSVCKSEGGVERTMMLIISRTHPQAVRKRRLGM